MRETLKRLARRLLYPTGLEFTTRAALDRTSAQIAALHARAMADATASVGRSPGVHVIAFSKDRPLQLDGLLRSIERCLTGVTVITVLYSASTDRYSAAYARLVSDYENATIRFRRERAFRDDLLAILAEVEQSRVMFLVDDIVFTRPGDLGDFLAYDPNVYVPSLRMGRNIRQSYNARRGLDLPPLRPSSGHTPLIEWHWRDGEAEWGYPLSVDGHLFAAEEIRLLAEVSPFAGPNSFEQALQTFVPVFRQRCGVCYPDAILVNIPFNRVQSEVLNASSGISPLYLLDAYETGQRLDIEALHNATTSGTHEAIDLKLVPADCARRSKSANLAEPGLTATRRFKHKSVFDKSAIITVGPIRSATTWLYNVFVETRKVEYTKIKEIAYFNNNYHMGPQWYISQFTDKGHDFFVDVTPHYLDTLTSCERIARDLPHASIIVGIRDHLERIRSMLELFSWRPEARSYEDFAGYFMRQLQTQILISDRVDFLQREFGERLYFLDFARLRHDPLASARDMLAHCGLAGDVPSIAGLVIHSAYKTRDSALAHASRRAYHLSKRLLPPNLIWRLRAHLGEPWFLNKVKFEQIMPEEQFETLIAPYRTAIAEDMERLRAIAAIGNRRDAAPARAASAPAGQPHSTV